VPKLSLCVFGRRAGSREQGCVSATESMPTQPGNADLLARRFEVAMEEIGAVVRLSVAIGENKSFPLLRCPVETL
jgi:hypothetical protein